MHWLFWFLYNHVTSPAEGLHFSALVIVMCSVKELTNYNSTDTSYHQLG